MGYLHRVLSAGVLLLQALEAAAAGPLALAQALAAAAAPKAQAAAGAPPQAAPLMLARLPPAEQLEIPAPAAVAACNGHILIFDIGSRHKQSKASSSFNKGR